MGLDRISFLVYLLLFVDSFDQLSKQLTSSLELSRLCMCVLQRALSRDSGGRAAIACVTLRCSCGCGCGCVYACARTPREKRLGDCFASAAFARLHVELARVFACRLVRSRRPSRVGSDC